MEFIAGNLNTLDVIIGPMFSGKTTELMRRLNICAEAKYKVLYVNSVFDDRDTATLFSTHNKTLKEDKSIIILKTKNLEDIYNEAEKFDVIGIDEAQFFNDLKLFCLAMTERYGKKVIVAGLNGDFERRPFGQINDLITLCDTISKLHSFCQICCEKRMIKPALFSKRIGESKETILVGKKDLYLPVCRDCYKI